MLVPKTQPGPKQLRHTDGAVETIPQEVSSNSKGPIRRETGSVACATQTLRITCGGRIISLPVFEIEYFTSAGNYIHVHRAGGSYKIRLTMKELESRLDPMIFARVHRCAIVNVFHVKNCRALPRGDSMITLLGGQELVVTRKDKDFYQVLARTC